MRILPHHSDRAILAELGQRLQHTRLERNLSQAKLAEEAGIGRVTLQRIEDGKPASMVNLIRVLRALDLLEGLDQLVPPPTASPLDELRRQGQQRQRAGSPRRSQRSPGSRPSGSWRWGDEAGPEES